jgi:hypothetical protein
MNNTLRRSLNVSVFSWIVVLAMGVGLLGSVSAAGQTPPLGTGAPGLHAVVPNFAAPTATPFKTYKNASYGTGGIALRNRGIGVLHVSGVSGPVQDAYLYWAILFNTTQPDPDLYHVTLRRMTFLPFEFVGVHLKGTLLGIAADPYWGSKGAAVFRAQVPKCIARGNGAYEVVLPRESSGLTDGQDPWDGNVVFPLAEGASLVIVGTGNYTVGIYDAGFTATMFGCEPAAPYVFTYTLTLPVDQAPTSNVLWDNIGADGQAGHGRTDYPSDSLETTFINGVHISGGAGALDNDSDWDGSAGLPIPQLWDDTGHDISAAFVGGPAPATAEITFTNDGDCVVTVANVLAVLPAI